MQQDGRGQNLRPFSNIDWFGKMIQSEECKEERHDI